MRRWIESQFVQLVGNRLPCAQQLCKIDVDLLPIASQRSNLNKCRVDDNDDDRDEANNDDDDDNDDGRSTVKRLARFYQTAYIDRD